MPGKLFADRFDLIRVCSSFISYIFIITLLVFVGLAYGQAALKIAAPDFVASNGDDWLRGRAKVWEAATGNKVEFVAVPKTNEEQRAFAIEQLAGDTDIDIFLVDTVWVGMLAPYAMDLSDGLAEEYISSLIPELAAVGELDGRRVAVPMLGDVGLLYYRADLLRKYGYTHPPQSWDELEAMAAKIQRGERSVGQSGFWGYLFQGANSEALVCNAAEWIAAEGGSELLLGNGDRQTLRRATLALERASGWVGSISPPDVIYHREGESWRKFAQGQAAFMRNWPGVYYMLRQVSANRGEFGIAPLPGPAVTGGWYILVAQQTDQPEVAVEFVNGLLSLRSQREIAYNSMMPSMAEIYADPGVFAKNPWLRLVRDAYNQAIARPSAVYGKNYPEAATIISDIVSASLSGKISSSEAALQLAQGLAELRRRGSE